MITAREIIDMYVAFFEKRDHKKIPNAPLVPENDPTTLFTTAGMQQLVPYLLGEAHPLGKRLVNVQNSFRAQDIDEIGDNRHTTFFRMLGNWSLGDYFKKEQLPWIFTFITKELDIPASKLYVTVFEGYNDIPRDTEAETIWKELFTSAGVNPNDRIFSYGPTKNWWSRTGIPDNMPEGEPGGPSSEIFFDLETPHNKRFGETCHVNCDCGRFIEILNNVFMEYKKQKDGNLTPLSQKNVDQGAGMERLLLAVENQPDVFQTSLLTPVISTIEKTTGKTYKDSQPQMRIVTDHFISAMFISAAHVVPSNKEQGYISRRLIRRGLDNFYAISGKDITPVLETIASQYGDTDKALQDDFETIKLTILQEEQGYKKTQERAKQYIVKKYQHTGDELKGITTISPDDTFILYSTHGLSPTQIKSLGYVFDEQAFAKKMEEHQELSRRGAAQKFAGGLADHQEKTIMGHTATHLLHQALRDVLGNHVYQTGSNITTERVRFDFNFDRKLTNEELQKVEQIVNEKIAENLPVHFEMMPLKKAKELGAIGLFDEKYQEKVKVYFIDNYSKEFCGGPHVDFTGRLKQFTMIKQENIGHGQRRIYATVGL